VNVQGIKIPQIQQIEDNHSEELEETDLYE